MTTDPQNDITRYSAAVLLDGDKVLLGKRTSTRSNYPGIWDFIGGHCERNESYEETLLRELQEEIGVTPTQSMLIMTVDESPSFILKLFLVTKWIGSIHNCAPEEHELLAWFKLSEAKQLEFLNGNYLQALEIIQRMMKDESLSEFKPEP